MEQDDFFMRRTFELASLGLGRVSPNPLVGCVIVANEVIIGEGWHRKFGEEHAEVNAITSVDDHALLRHATAYVNLEPCSHHGKTPPCADKLIEIGIKRVVISNKDTNPLVGGKGIEKLRSAGIKVDVGILEEEGKTLNRRFFTWIRKESPFVILKWAESSDGFLGTSNGPTLISNEYSRQRVHQWRSEEDAVLVGTRTVEIDNPQLNVRDWSGRNPVRVYIDRSLRLSGKLNLLDGSQPTLCYNLMKDEQTSMVTFVKLPDEQFLNHLLRDLAKRGIGSVIVEGGAQTLEWFIASGCWHEARIFKTGTMLHSGVAAPRLQGMPIREDSLSGDRLTWLSNPAAIRI